MLITVAWIIILLGIAWAVWLYRDKLAEWWPGLKHAVSGIVVVVSGALTAIEQYVRDNQSLFGQVLMDKPLALPLGMITLGALILMLSWVTPRKEE